METTNLDAVFIPELKKCHEELRRCEETMSEAHKQEKRKLFSIVSEMLLEMSYIARYEGLLSLVDYEDAKLGDEKCESVLHQLITQILDSTLPEVIERNAMMVYYSMPHNEYQGIAHIMLIYGMLSIQAGMHPRRMVEVLQGMVPYGVKIKEYERPIRTSERKIWTLEEVYSGELRVTLAQKGYLEIYMCDRTLRALDNRAIQRILRDTDDYVLARVMEGISGEGRKAILENVTPDNRNELIELLDKDFAPDEKIENEYTTAYLRRYALRFLEIINKLENTAEIVLDRTPELGFLNDIVKFLNAQSKNKEETVKSCDLFIRMMQYYKSTLD